MGDRTISIRKVVQRLMWPRRRVLFLGLVLIFISNFAGLVIPASTEYLIDDVIANRDYSLLTKILILIACAIVVQAIISFALTKLLSIEAHRIIAELRIELQKKVLSLPVGFFDRNKSGVLVQRIMNDVDGVRDILGKGFVHFVSGLITALFALGMLFYISTELTLYILIPVAFTAFLFYKSFSYLRPLYRKRRAENADVQGRLTETIGGITVVKGFNAEAQESAVFAKGVYRIYEYIKKTMTTEAWIESIATLFVGLTIILIMGFGSHKIISQELSIGEFLSFSIFLASVVAPVNQMSRVGSQLTDAFAGLDRTEEILSMTSENEDELRTVEMKSLHGHLSFNQVSFAYHTEKAVLKNITVDFLPNTITALVGPSGSGKSTLAGLITTLISPDSGSITIDGTELNKVTLDSYRRHIGMVMQEDFLFDGTIRENIVFSRPDASESDLQNAVTSAYVNEFTDKLALGLDTIIGERGVKLSGGQKQRISIARALLSDPKILILDEATSNLDMESEQMIQDSLSQLFEGRTTIVIAHRLSTIRKADQILVLDNGAIKETGTHDVLMDKKGTYFHLFNLQSKI